MTERLKIEHLYKVFSERPARALDMLRGGATKADVLRETGQAVGLDDVSLSVPAGAMYMIMGLSGSGKSTLARCVNRLNEPSAGRILLDETDLCSLDEAALREVRRNRISMVFQHFALLPNRRVIDNVEFGLKLRGVGAAARRQRAEQVLDVVGLARWAGKLPHELSGGMRQRVGLARALATDADILIMDEAFSALDPLIRAEMQDELLRLQRTLHKTILFITHDFQEALKLGTRIAIMSEGRLVREGTPQSIVLEPGNDYVAAFTREVDRARLFNAASSMTALVPLVAGERWTVLGAAGEDTGPAFVVDTDAHVLGTLDGAQLGAQLGALRAGGALPELDRRFACVPGHARLIDAAAHFGAARAVGVIDESGRLIGRLEARQVLARIGAGGATGVRHV